MGERNDLFRRLVVEGSRFAVSTRTPVTGYARMLFCSLLFSLSYNALQTHKKTVTQHSIPQHSHRMRFPKQVYLLLLAVVCCQGARKSNGRERGARRRTQQAPIPVLIEVEGRPGLVTESQFVLLQELFVDTYNQLTQTLCPASASSLALSSVAIERQLDTYVPPGFGTASRTFTLECTATTSSPGLFYREYTITTRRAQTNLRKPKSKGYRSPSKSPSKSGSSKSSKSGTGYSKSTSKSGYKPDSPSEPGETTPVPGETTPVPGETTPVPGETTPVPGETTPVPGETTPVPTPGDNGSDRAGADCDGLSEAAFLVAYSSAVQARSADLESSITAVVDVAEMEPVPCADATSEFLPDVIVTFEGDDSLATAEQLDALAQSFGQTYNALNQLNPDTCDAFFRSVVSVSLVTDQGFNRRLHEDQRHLQVKPWKKFSYLYQVTGQCRACGSNTRLFNDVQGRLLSESSTAAFPFMERHLQVSDCVCPVTASDLRPPTNLEFQEGYQTSIDILKEEGVILPDYIVRVVSVKEVDEQTCGDIETFTPQVYVDLFGFPDNVTTFELDALAVSFTNTYNELAGDTCDPVFRSIESVSIDTDPASDNGRRLQAQAWTPQTFRYLFTVEGLCRTCGSNSRLFDDVVGRMLADLANAQHGRRFQEENLCFCTPEAVDIQRAPTEDEFAVAYNDTVKSLNLTNILYVVDVVEKLSDGVASTPAPTTAVPASTPAPTTAVPASTQAPTTAVPASTQRLLLQCLLQHQRLRLQCLLQRQRLRLQCLLQRQRPRLQCLLQHQRLRLHCLLQHQRPRLHCLLQHQRPRLHCLLQHQRPRLQCPSIPNPHRPLFPNPRSVRFNRRQHPLNLEAQKKRQVTVRRRSPLARQVHPLSTLRLYHPPLPMQQ